jgi:hypothetical protein
VTASSDPRGGLWAAERGAPVVVVVVVMVVGWGVTSFGSGG